MGREQHRGSVRRAATTLARGLLALSTIAMLPVLLADPARAHDNCTPVFGEHCYGIAIWNNSGTLGGKTSLWMTSQTNWEGATNFINQELWTITPNGGWVEVGYTTGPIQGAGGSLNERWFWADTRPNCGWCYFEHVINGIGNPWDVWNTWQPVAAYTLDGVNYRVEARNVWVGTSSTQDCCFSPQLQSGVEAEDQAMTTHSGTGVLQWLSVYGWINGWNAGGTHANPYQTHCYFNWYIANISALDGCN